MSLEEIDIELSPTGMTSTRGEIRFAAEAEGEIANHNGIHDISTNQAIATSCFTNGEQEACRIFCCRGSNGRRELGFAASAQTLIAYESDHVRIVYYSLSEMTKL